MVRRIARVEALVCDSAHEAAWLERNLLERRLPPWNRSRGGQEVPVWVRLDGGGPAVRCWPGSRPRWRPSGRSWSGDATGRLHFEAATRVQAELEAFDWLVAEQKVTVADPVDLAAYGWEAGILIRLGVRRGRLCEWDQTRRERRPATLLAATPEAWRPFADRAAGTGATLMGVSG